MTLEQLHKYSGELLKAGINPHAVVCIPESDDGELYELVDLDLVNGSFREDPSPKMPAPLHRRGQVVRLKSIDFDSSLIDTEGQTVTDMPIDAPEKQWPNGWGK